MFDVVDKTVWRIVVSFLLSGSAVHLIAATLREQITDVTIHPEPIVGGWLTLWIVIGMIMEINGKDKRWNTYHSDNATSM